MRHDFKTVANQYHFPIQKYNSKILAGELEQQHTVYIFAPAPISVPLPGHLTSARMETFFTAEGGESPLTNACGSMAIKPLKDDQA